MSKHNIKTHILTGKDVRDIVEKFGIDTIMDSLILNLEKAIKNFNSIKTEIPIRSGFNYDLKHNGLIEWMPVHEKNHEVVIKVVGYHPENPSKYNLPTILSSISSYDTATGHLKGLVDGVLLTALRTGAASAVASKYLAKPDSSILGLIGCGAQAVTQLHALSRIFELKEVLIYDVDLESMNTFEERTSMLHTGAQIKFSSINEIIEVSDIVCTETSKEVGTPPLFEYRKTKNHLHINAIGSDFPGKTELPKELLYKSFVCPDFPAQAKLEGECQQLEDSAVGPDWVEVLKNPTNFNTVQNKLSVFDSTGWAFEDQVVMELFLKIADKNDIGIKVALENISEDAKNPYRFLLKTINA